MLRVRSPGKVNLILSVGGSAEGGLHQIYSLMTTVSVYDHLLFSPSKTTTFICDSDQIDSNDNLCLQAIGVLADHVNRPLTVTVELRKTLPIGGGLGGGSGNAAAVLIALNELFRLGLSRRELAGVASGIGSDVPFFIDGGVQIVTGSGGDLTPVAMPLLSTVWFVLANPGVFSSTAEAYRDFDAGRHPGQMAPAGPDRRAVKALGRGDVGSVMVNDLQDVVFSRLPILASVEREMLAQGAVKALLCGSGATVFGLFDGEDRARAAAAALQKRWSWVTVAQAAQGIEVCQESRNAC